MSIRDLPRERRKGGLECTSPIAAQSRHRHIPRRRRDRKSIDRKSNRSVLLSNIRKSSVGATNIPRLRIADISGIRKVIRTHRTCTPTASGSVITVAVTIRTTTLIGPGSTDISRAGSDRSTDGGWPGAGRSASGSAAITSQ